MHLDSGSAASEPRLRLNVLDDVRAWLDDVEIDLGPRQQRVILTALLVHNGQPVTMRELIALVWDEDAPASAANTIHRCVSALRRAFEPSLPPRQSGRFIVRQGGSYRFARVGYDLDLSSRREAAQAARRATGPERSSLYADALGSGPYRTAAPLNADGALEELLSAVDNEYRALCLDATSACLAAGQSAQILPALYAATRAYRLDETLHIALIRVLAANGRRAEAFDIYGRIRHALADELGVDVSAELRDAYQELLEDSAEELTNGGSAEQPSKTEFSGAQVSPPLALPPRLRTFVGRARELEALHADFAAWWNEEPSGPLVQILYGGGAVGKSAIEVAYARSVAHSFPDGHIYIDLRSKAHAGSGNAPHNALHRLLSALGIPAEAIPQDRQAQVALFRTATASKRILLVVDNADFDIDLGSMVPPHERSLMLVSGRRRHLALELDHGALCLNIGPLDDEATSEMLGKRVRGGVASALGEIEAVSGAAGALVAARVAADLNHALDPTEEARAPHMIESIAARSRTDLDRLGGARAVSTDAARLLELLAMAQLDSLSIEACATLACSTTAETESLLEELTTSALVTESAENRYSLHPVAAVALNLDSGERSHSRDFHLGRLITHYYQAIRATQRFLTPSFVPDVPEPPAHPDVIPAPVVDFASAMAWFEREQSALSRLVHLAAEISSGICPWLLVLSLQDALLWLGRIDGWAQLARFAEQDAESRGDDLGQAYMLRSLAGAQFHQGRLEQSRARLSRALGIFLRHGKSSEAARTHLNLGMVHDRLGESGPALLQYCRASALYRDMGAERGNIRAMQEIGRVLLRSGDHEQAAWILSNALTKTERLGDVREAADTRISLGLALSELGQHEAAMEHIKRSARDAEQLGHLHLQLEAAAALGRIYHRLGDDEGLRHSLDRVEYVLPQFSPGDLAAAHEEEIRFLRRIAAA